MRNKTSSLEILAENYLSKPAIINKGILIIYNLMKEKNFSGPADWFIQAYMGGELKRKDQELFAKITDKEPYMLTIKNGVLICALSPPYYPMDKGL